MAHYGTYLQVNKENIREAQIINHPLKKDDIAVGEVLIEVSSFAYTSNNTTYAVFGDRIGYWYFYPLDNTKYGMIPCWGFGEVIASNVDEVEVGERFYGFYPMGTHFIARPGKISSYGWTDMMAHRTSLPPIYNQFISCDTDPLYTPELEPLQSIFRPLFTTSFLINDMYVKRSYFGAEQIILTSASSKTALALAFCLKDQPVEVIGLTSPHRVEMVSSTGCYDEVLSYADISNIPNRPSSIVDFSGSVTLRSDLGDQLGDQLTYLCLVGFVDWESQKGGKEGPKGEMFFAPSHAQEKIKEVGVEKFTLELGTKYKAFVHTAKEWIEVDQRIGSDALLDLHQLITDGKADASKGYIISLR